MIETVLSLLSATFLVVGTTAILIGALGIIRMPDLFSRIHAVGITDTAGAGLLTAGLLIESGFSLVSLKLLIILLFLLFTSPTSSHALAKAAIHGEIQPYVGNQ